MIVLISTTFTENDFDPTIIQLLCAEIVFTSN